MNLASSPSPSLIVIISIDTIPNLTRVVSRLFGDCILRSSRTNVFQIHPPRTILNGSADPKRYPRIPALIKSKYVREEFANELDRLADEIMDHDPNLIICLGNCALWALAGRTGIT